MLFSKFVIFLICIILLSISTSALVEFLCVKDLVNPKLWNHDSVKKYNNCYIYALNKPKTTRVKKTSPGLGEIGGGEKGIGDFGRDYSNYTCKYFNKLIKHDIPGIKKSNTNSVQELQCPPDHYEIALVLDDGKLLRKWVTMISFYEKIVILNFGVINQVLRLLLKKMLLETLF